MRKLLGAVLGVFSLGSAMFFVMAVTDLLTGGSPETGRGVLAGLAVFFGGLMAFGGLGAWRLLTSQGIAARAEGAADDARVAAASRATTGIDLDLEARVLALAAQHDGRVTVAEVALACGVKLDQAEAALDGLARRDHADLQVTPDGDRVYVLRGFLSAEEKRAAHEVASSS